MLRECGQCGHEFEQEGRKGIGGKNGYVCESCMHSNRQAYQSKFVKDHSQSTAYRDYDPDHLSLDDVSDLLP